MIGVFFEIQQGGGFYALDVATVGQEVAVKLKDLILGIFFSSCQARKISINLLV